MQYVIMYRAVKGCGVSMNYAANAKAITANIMISYGVTIFNPILKGWYTFYEKHNLTYVN